MGVPLLQVSVADADALQSAIEADPALVVTVDVKNKEVRYADTVVKAVIDAGHSNEGKRQWDATGQLLDGVDDVRYRSASIYHFI